jgi:hypothetical protein
MSDQTPYTYLRLAAEKELSMSHKMAQRLDELVSGLPSLMIPLLDDPTPEELVRRQKLVKRARELRQTIREESGPFPVSTGELKHESREDELG